MEKNRFLWLLIVSLVVGFWSMPAFAGKALLTDDALDAVTAGGDSQVVMASSGGTTDVNLVDNAQFLLDIPTNAQQGLRALTVQNVVGEVQLLVNLNVLSAQNNVNGTDQRNFAVQSWGSTAPLAVATVSGEAAGNGGDAAAAAGGTGGVGGSGGTIAQASVGTNVNTGTANGGNANGGNAAAAPGGNGGNAAQGLIGIGIGSGDGIAQAIGGGANCVAALAAAGALPGTTCAQADSVNNSKFALTLEPNSQINLATLFVANIVGRAQTAFNINIAAATLNLIPDAGQPFATPFDNGTGVIKQVNSGVQFRGTPIGVGNTSMNLTVTHTPN